MMPTGKLKNIAVSRYMATTLMTFRPEMRIREAVALLVKHKYTGAAVVDTDGALVGMLSEKDCLRVAVLANVDGEAAALVGDYMTTQLDTVGPHTNLFEVAERFVGSPYKRFPVVDGGRLVGQISRFDVMRAIADLF